MMTNQHKPYKPARARTRQRAGWARVPGIARMGSHRMLLVALGVGLCVVAAGVAIAISSSSTGQVHPVAGPGSSAPPAGAPGAQPKASAAPSHPAAGATVTGHGIAGNALRSPPRLKHTLARWAKGPGGAALSAVTAQLGNAMQAAGGKLYPTMKQACTTLTADVARARAAPPIPEAAMQHLYARSLTGLDRAAAGCRNAISVRNGDETNVVHLNGPLLSRSRAEFAALSARLYRATAEIRFMDR